MMRELSHHGVDGDTEWMNDAACEGNDPDLFFPPSGHNELSAAALAICASCQVREACLEYALDNYQDHGIWGGTTARERTRIRRLRRRT